MQIATAAKASKELPLGGSGSSHSVSAPLGGVEGFPAEKYFPLSVGRQPGPSSGTAQEGHRGRAAREP